MVIIIIIITLNIQISVDLNGQVWADHPSYFLLLPLHSTDRPNQLVNWLSEFFSFSDNFHKTFSIWGFAMIVRKDIWTHSSWSSSQGGPGLSSHWLSTASRRVHHLADHRVHQCVHLHDHDYHQTTPSIMIIRMVVMISEDRAISNGGCNWQTWLQVGIGNLPRGNLLLHTTPPARHRHEQIYLLKI